MATLYLYCCVRALSSCADHELLSGCGAWASHCSGFSCCETQGLERLGFSRCGSQSLQHRVSSCGARLSCCTACRIFPDQGLNWYPLRWQVDSQPLDTTKEDLLLSFRSFLYILGINPLSDIRFANIFFHCIGCLFTVDTVFKCIKKFLLK